MSSTVKEYGIRHDYLARIQNKIKDGLRSQDKILPKHRWFWLGFIVALVDTNDITDEEYRTLRDFIETYQK